MLEKVDANNIKTFNEAISSLPKTSSSMLVAFALSLLTNAFVVHALDALLPFLTRYESNINFTGSITLLTLWSMYNFVVTLTLTYLCDKLFSKESDHTLYYRADNKIYKMQVHCETAIHFFAENHMEYTFSEAKDVTDEIEIIENNSYPA